MNFLYWVGWISFPVHIYELLNTEENSYIKIILLLFCQNEKLFLFLYLKNVIGTLSLALWSSRSYQDLIFWTGFWEANIKSESVSE